MAPGLGECAQSQETHGVSTCLTQFLLALPLRVQATLGELKSPVGPLSRPGAGQELAWETLPRPPGG